jgi:hypothetical protein
MKKWANELKRVFSKDEVQIAKKKKIHEVMFNISGHKNVFLIIAYAYSSTKLEKRAEQVLPGSEGVGGR